MRKSIKITLIVLSVVLLMGIALKAWWLYQNNYVCVPKVRSAVEKFVNAVVLSEYETMSDNSMFASKAQFKEIKTKMSNVYSLEVKDWAGDGAAYAIIKLSNNKEYALMVVPTKAATFSCWGKEYKVLTIR